MGVADNLLARLNAEFATSDTKLTIKVDGNTSNKTLGVIMSSPDGTLYKLTVANNGTLTATAVA